MVLSSATALEATDRDAAWVLVEFALKNRRDRAQRHLRLFETRLARCHALEQEARNEERTRRTGPRRLHELPELHRHREREHGPDERREHGRRQRPEALAERRDREHQRGEVRPTARREARRSRVSLPCLAQTPFLRGRDRSVLGAVEEQRAAAQ